MVYKKITDSGPVADYLAGKLAGLLAAGKRVLWLVAGGSAVAVTAAVSKQLAGKDLHNLTVTLTDERYGQPGHADANWKQMADAGVDLPGATMVPVLQGADRAATTEAFGASLETAFSQSDYTLGFFGIGADGHTAGILPGTAAVRAAAFAASYDAPDFERITMTPKAIARLHEAVVYAMGESKWPVLDALEGDLPLDAQPAQALKTVPELTIFNDYKGEEI